MNKTAPTSLNDVQLQSSGWFRSCQRVYPCLLSRKSKQDTEWCGVAPKGLPKGEIYQDHEHWSRPTSAITTTNHSTAQALATPLIDPDLEMSIRNLSRQM